MSLSTIVVFGTHGLPLPLTALSTSTDLIWLYEFLSTEETVELARFLVGFFVVFVARTLLEVDF